MFRDRTEGPRAVLRPEDFLVGSVESRAAAKPMIQQREQCTACTRIIVSAYDGNEPDTDTVVEVIDSPCKRHLGGRS